MSVNHARQHVIIVGNKALFMQHYTGKGHPERAQRVKVIEEALIAANLMNDKNTVFPRQATLSEIKLCHDQTYLEELQRQIDKLRKREEDCIAFEKTWNYLNHIAGDFQISLSTLDVSLYAAGAPLTAIEYILNEDNRALRAFCIVRPPGHHAHRNIGSGFCVFNNIAIAARHLIQHFGFQRVLIVDWDAHHGDGTQELTEDDDKIFYFSTHKDTAHGFYPGRQWGRADQIGIGKGKGTVLNCPVSGSPEECRQKILMAFRNQLTLAMERYRPEFVLISCGFDAHENDPLVGELGLQDEDYREMTMICVSIAEKYAKGRVVSVLEGGYNLKAIANSAKIHVEALH